RESVCFHLDRRSQGCSSKGRTDCLERQNTLHQHAAVDECRRDNARVESGPPVWLSRADCSQARRPSTLECRMESYELCRIATFRCLRVNIVRCRTQEHL